MATTSPPFRIEDEVYTSAAAAATRMSRSTSQQITHWARIGRELESSGSVSARDVEAVLSGERSYDDVSSFVQAAVRVRWDSEIDAAVERLDMAEVLAAEGATALVELDDDGQVVERRLDR